jgi:hypothetical protein
MFSSAEDWRKWEMLYMLKIIITRTRALNASDDAITERTEVL